MLRGKIAPKHELSSVTLTLDPTGRGFIDLETPLTLDAVILRI